MCRKTCTRISRPHYALLPTALFFLAMGMHFNTLVLFAIERTCQNRYGASCNELSDDESSAASKEAEGVYTAVLAASNVLSPAVDQSAWRAVRFGSRLPPAG